MDGAFGKGTAEVQPAFLFAWDAANLRSPVTQKRRANKGIFRWSLRAFSFVFPCREGRLLNLGVGWGGARHKPLEGRGLCEMRSLKPY